MMALLIADLLLYKIFWLGKKGCRISITRNWDLSQYIISKDFEWNFAIDDKDFQPLFNELNKYVKRQLSDGID